MKKVITAVFILLLVQGLPLAYAENPVASQGSASGGVVGTAGPFKAGFFRLCGHKLTDCYDDSNFVEIIEITLRPDGTGCYYDDPGGKEVGLMETVKWTAEGKSARIQTPSEKSKFKFVKDKFYQLGDKRFYFKRDSEENAFYRNTCMP